MSAIARHMKFQGAAFLFYGVTGLAAYATNDERSGGIVSLLVFVLAVAIGVQRVVSGVRGNTGGTWSEARGKRWVLTVFSALALLIGVLRIVVVLAD